jgi:hypothetical protein
LDQSFPGLAGTLSAIVNIVRTGCPDNGTAKILPGKLFRPSAVTLFNGNPDGFFCLPARLLSQIAIVQELLSVQNVNMDKLMNLCTDEI